MGKYMRKSKTAGEVALVEVSHAQSALGVRTRARTLALQRLQTSAVAAAAAAEGGDGRSYLQLRSRRLEKPPIGTDGKRQKQGSRDSRPGNPNPSPNQSVGSRGNSRLNVNSGKRVPEEKEKEKKKENLKGKQKEKEGIELINPVENEKINGGNGDESVEGSFGENVLEFEGKERTARESTPCSLIRDPENIRTPGSSTRPTSVNETNSRPDSIRRYIPTAHDMDEFFSNAEQEQHRKFIEKYNFDPVNEKPLPGRYEWVKLTP